jgi:hypothetical protein
MGSIGDAVAENHGGDASWHDDAGLPVIIAEMTRCGILSADETNLA